jgi:hypothetical protein
MARKLAIVISGAVSLGSYEAGVMVELLEAIALHNEMLGADQHERVEIDVITGASAGAMTAAILSQHLYYGGTRLRNPYDNPLFDAWVREVDIEALLKVERSEHRYSLLSSSVIDRIGERHLPDDPGPALDRHPAAADSLRVGLAMSNLNGFSQTIAGKRETIAYSRYKDQFVCAMTVAQPADGPTVELTELEPRWRRESRQVIWEPMASTCSWSILRLMAFSSGAFPFAFRARRIVREGGSRESLMRRRDSSRKATAGDRLYGGNYLYTDGGVFENEPVGMAADLVRDLDQEDAAAARSYLFVAPGKRTIDVDPFFNRDDDLIAMALGLASAVFGESRFQQWITEGLEGQLLSVTASDAQLIGDVFSAFAGFLEYDFRAHDYNVGRVKARQELRDGRFADLIGDFQRLDGRMPMILWRARHEPPPPIQVPDGAGAWESEVWKRRREELSSLANPCIVEGNGARRRDQLQELRQLMGRVGVERRRLIVDQIMARVDSLIDFIHEDYLETQNGARRSGPVGRLVRQLVVRPITKWFLKRQIRPLLDDIVLRPGPTDPDAAPAIDPPGS